MLLKQNDNAASMKQRLQRRRLKTQRVQENATEKELVPKARQQVQERASRLKLSSLSMSRGPRLLLL
jgi:hypothetical protein